jgi:hypothetical protein
MSATAKILDFDELYSLKQYLDGLRERHVRSLVTFEDKKSKGFKQSDARKDKPDLSMSSTATCIGSLVQTGMWHAAIRTTDAKKGWWVGREALYREKLLTEPWTSAGLPTNNPFTVGFVVEACEHLRFAANLGQQGVLALQTRKAIRILHAALTKRSKGDNTPLGAVSVLQYPPSAYLTQLVARALTSVRQLTPNEADAVARWAVEEISSQLTLITADSRAADPVQLLYAILCATSYRPSSSRTPIDIDIVKVGLRTFFSRQLSNGGWPQSRPLFHYPAFGSAYCYDYEALAQLLLREELYEMLFEFLPQLAKSAYALEPTKFERVGGGYGWASNQTPQLPGPESWSTASVYLFLFALDRFLGEAIRRAVAHEVEVPYLGLRVPRTDVRDFAPAFLDCPFSATPTEKRTLKPQIFRALVEPVSSHVAAVQKGQRFPKTVPISAIFFGPPGTSKTEIAEQIANYIGWPLVTIDASYFVKAGMDQIQAQANRIFRMLSASEQIVVLFDEFDEMVRNRADASDILSRFLTTAMLPKLVTINKQRRILFIVATNYIDSFDIAISRPGRFDLVLQMMPPVAKSKIEHPSWASSLRWMRGLVPSSDFIANLNDLTYLETDKLVRKLNPLLKNPTSIAKRKAGRVWREAIASCTLARDNERYPVKNSTPGGPQFLTWKQTSIQETKFIRQD